MDESQDSITPTAYHCHRCGYNLTGMTIGSRCPECGELVDPAVHGAAKTSGYAIASMVLGILSVVSFIAFPPITVIFGGVAIVLWYLARQKISKGGYANNSKGLALVGLICGIIGTVLGLVFVLAIMAWIWDGGAF